MLSARTIVPFAICAALGAPAIVACSSLDPTPPVPHVDDPIYPDPEIVVAPPVTAPADGGETTKELVRPLPVTVIASV